MKSKTIEETPIDEENESKSKEQKVYPSLEKETRLAIPTGAAAFHCSRAPQTLRSWACLENGPIRPVRINGRLAWSVADIKKLLAEGGK